MGGSWAPGTLCEVVMCIMVKSVDSGTLLPVQVINWESYLFGISVSLSVN